MTIAASLMDTPFRSSPNDSFWGGRSPMLPDCQHCCGTVKCEDLLGDETKRYHVITLALSHMHANQVRIFTQATHNSLPTLLQHSVSGSLCSDSGT